jgi:hypothetical protein
MGVLLRFQQSDKQKELLRICTMSKIHATQMNLAHGANAQQFLLLVTLLKTQKHSHQQFLIATIFLKKNKIASKMMVHGAIPEE